MIPTLSQVEAYTTYHLVDAAEYWDRLAGRPRRRTSPIRLALKAGGVQYFGLG